MRSLSRELPSRTGDAGSNPIDPVRSYRRYRHLTIVTRLASATASCCDGQIQHIATVRRPELSRLGASAAEANRDRTGQDRHTDTDPARRPRRPPSNSERAGPARAVGRGDSGWQIESRGARTRT